MHGEGGMGLRRAYEWRTVEVAYVVLEEMEFGNRTGSWDYLRVGLTVSESDLILF